VTGFLKPAPGDQPDLVFNSRYHGAIVDVLARGGIMDPAAPHPTPAARQVSEVLVKNTTGSAVQRGGVLGIAGVITTADDDADHMLGTEPQLNGVSPDYNLHQDRFVITRQEIQPGDIGWCAAGGLMFARCMFSSANYTRAKIETGNAAHIIQSATGNIQIIDCQAYSSGEGWALIIPTSSGEVTPGISSSTSGAKAEWVSAENSIKDGCIHVWPLITPEDYDESTSYVAGDKILRTTSDTCLEKIIWEANATTTGTFDASKWDEKTGRRYIDKTATPEKWWHGMTEEPEEGHYCVGIKGELVYYDCFELPNYA
tara:strand:+ start:5002 stop:5943 length:942 start_codon:yes stop_codon:yes gene_type:complete